jgi:hypothetical protein
MESTFYFFNDFVDIPITSDEQYDLLQSLKVSTVSSTTEVVQTGKTEKLQQMEKYRNQLNDTIDADVRQAVCFNLG